MKKSQSHVKKTSPGKCQICGQEFHKADIISHLQQCLQKAPSGSGKPDKRFIAMVEGKFDKQYWLVADFKTDTRLSALDGFLRDIWLECCGHLSEFIIEGVEYCSFPEAVEEGAETMDIATAKVLDVGGVFEHRYDFGTTTHLLGGIVAAWSGPATRDKVRLLARNLPPSMMCASCGKPATVTCAYCGCPPDSLLCDDCAAKHACEDEAYLPVVNSPRCGMCAYTD